MIYLAMFLTTTLLLYASSRCKGVLEALLATAGLLLPCLLAGLRDETIGTDVLSYAKWMAIDAQNMGFIDFIQYEAETANSGWNVFTWITVNATGGLSGYLFCIEALCILPIYFGLRHMCRAWEWAGILSWLLLWYAFSLNGMRQCAAMSIVFYSTVYVLERRPLPFLVGIVAAVSLHQTAVVGLFIYLFAFIYRYSGSISNLLGKWRSPIVIAASICIVGICIVFGDRIVLALSFLKDSYSFQVNAIGENDFSFAGLYLTILISCLWGAARREFVSSTALIGEEPRAISRNGFDIACGVALIGSLLWQLNLASATLGRIGYYGTILIPLVVAMLGSNGPKTRSQFLFSMVCSSVYFVVITLMMGQSGVVPYTSVLLGISG